ncbi:AfsR/SARP family transcriptional regulator [Streptomyces boninensis]|uniref:AfsR/SARP family transcriptional regulator n=1 Tax=Streptomyces boninensis TaxID=2039455 RepID=UPI003B20EE8F
MKFRVLGPVEACAGDGRPIALPPTLTRLLAGLLSHPGEFVPAEALIGAVWDFAPPKAAAKSLQIHVHHLRRALGAEHVVLSAGSYALQVPPGACDAGRFENLAAEARSAAVAGEAADAARLFAQALALWRGPAFAGQECAVLVREEAARLEAARQRVTEERIDADLTLGRHGEVVAELTALVTRHPLRETLRAQLMLALHRLGRTAEALVSYEEGRRLLAEELGIDPGAQLRTLYLGLLRGDPALAASGQGTGAVPGPVTRQPPHEVPRRG